MSTALQDIRGVLASVKEAFGRGATAKEIVDLLYDQDLMLIGEGFPAASSGLKECLPLFEAAFQEWGPRPKLEMRISEPIQEADELAVTVVGVTCYPDVAGAEPVRYRMMAAWKPTSRGWRVVVETFTYGVL